jgi:hypothetical protein
MSTEPAHICPDCGSEFSGAMEFCPVCMLRTALDGDVEPGESTSEDAVKPTAEPVAQRFENYELVKGDDGTPMELGRGAMGVTYKALDVDLHCLVTLKVISERYLGDESARLRFLREARAAASVRHPNVASVLHLGRTGSRMPKVQIPWPTLLWMRPATPTLSVAGPLLTGRSPMHLQNRYPLLLNGSCTTAPTVLRNVRIQVS